MNYLVVDIGSSNGKIYLASLSGQKRFLMEEIDRFTTERSFFEGHLSTNIFALFDRICSVIKDLVRQGIVIDALGIDSWCCDYSIIDGGDGSVSMPVFYRDQRTDGILPEVYRMMEQREIYARTTQREIDNSTLCQLLAYQKEFPDGLKGDKKILFIGDLLMYLFTGRLCSEISVASYSQLFNMHRQDWETAMFEAFEIPVSIAPPVVRPGTLLGPVKPALAHYLGADSFGVVAPAVHDTASAAAAVPHQPGEKWAFLATGSWFLMSMALEQPADLDKSYQYQLSNTGMGFGKTLLKKNITAMWLVQECKRQWDDMGLSFTYPELAALAEAAAPFAGFVDTEDPRFAHPEKMATEICRYLSESGRSAAETEIGKIVRIIYESIVEQSVRALKMLEDTTGTDITVLYVIGGAARIALLNQMLADALGIKIKIGPYEATAVGNALFQAYGMGQIKTEQEINQIVRESFPGAEFNPRPDCGWQQYLEAIDQQQKEREAG